jgi:hypothetical protein
VVPENYFPGWCQRPISGRWCQRPISVVLSVVPETYFGGAPFWWCLRVVLGWCQRTTSPPPGVPETCFRGRLSQGAWRICGTSIQRICGTSIQGEEGHNAGCPENGQGDAQS